jgi:hypothetical protein
VQEQFRYPTSSGGAPVHKTGTITLLSSAGAPPSLAVGQSLIPDCLLSLYLDTCENILLTMRCLLLLLLFVTSSYSQNADSTGVTCTYLAFTPGGDAVVTALTYTSNKNNKSLSTSQVVKWSTTSGQKLFSIDTKANSQYVTSVANVGRTQYVAVSRKGDLFVTCAGKKASVWSLADGKLIRVIDTKSAHDIWQVTFSEDGSLLATVSYDNADVWRTSDGSFVRRFTQPEWIVNFDFSPDGKYITSHPGYRLREYEERDQRKRYAGYPSHQLSMKWEVATGKLVRPLLVQYTLDSASGFMAIDSDSIPYVGKDLFEVAKSFQLVSYECPKQEVMITGDTWGFIQWDKTSFRQKKWYARNFPFDEGLNDVNCSYLLSSRNVYRTIDFAPVMKFGSLDQTGLGWDSHHGALSPTSNKLAFIKEVSSDTERLGKRLLKIVTLPEGAELFSIPLN